jgi:hypothetical protein
MLTRNTPASCTWLLTALVHKPCAGSDNRTSSIQLYPIKTRPAVFLGICGPVALDLVAWFTRSHRPCRLHTWLCWLLSNPVHTLPPQPCGCSTTGWPSSSTSRNRVAQASMHSHIDMVPSSVAGCTWLWCSTNLYEPCKRQRPATQVSKPASQPASNYVHLGVQGGQCHVPGLVDLWMLHKPCTCSPKNPDPAAMSQSL